MDLRRLTLFLAVADTAGFSWAADALGMSQPAVSQGVRELEAELGTELFHRLGRSARLTAAGEAPASRGHGPGGRASGDLHPPPARRSVLRRRRRALRCGRHRPARGVAAAGTGRSGSHAPAAAPGGRRPPPGLYRCDTHAVVKRMVVLTHRDSPLTPSAQRFVDLARAPMSAATKPGFGKRRDRSPASRRHSSGRRSASAHKASSKSDRRPPCTAAYSYFPRSTPSC